MSEGLKKLKILHIPDLHLFDREIGNSIGYADESIKNLDNIKSTYISGDYDMVTLGGDIQHAKMESTRYMSQFMKLLSEIGEIAKTRLEELGILDVIEVYDQNGDIIDLSEYKSIIFTVKGQHDINNLECHTFFDMLVENKIIINPRTVLIKGFQMNFINYTKVVEDFKEPKRDTTKVMVNVMHFPILENGIVVDNFKAKTVSPSEHGFFHGVDLALINDIHKPIASYEVNTDGYKTICITPGSVGRTALDDSNDRDIANLVVLGIDFEGEYGLDVDLLELELKPSDEFFNKTVAIQKKISKNAFENFRLEISNVEIDYFNPVDEIAALKGVEEEIKDIAIGIYEGRYDK